MISTKDALNAISIEDEFSGAQEQSGGFETIVTHYTLTAPKVPQPNVSQLKQGDAVIGSYEGNYVEPMYGKVKHRIRTAEGLVTVPGGQPGTGQLNKRLANTKEGDRLRIVYQGMSEVTKGKNAGTKAHGFAVTFSRLNGN